jgi:hypothetical protein
MVAGWLPYMYVGKEKAGEMLGKLIRAEARALAFLVWLSWSPPLALEVTGDLDDKEYRDGRSRNDLTRTGITGCDGGIDKRLREEAFLPTFPLLSPARTK